MEQALESKKLQNCYNYMTRFTAVVGVGKSKPGNSIFRTRSTRKLQNVTAKRQTPSTETRKIKFQSAFNKLKSLKKGTNIPAALCKDSGVTKLNLTKSLDFWRARSKN